MKLAVTNAIVVLVLAVLVEVSLAVFSIFGLLTEDNNHDRASEAGSMYMCDKSTLCFVSLTPSLSLQ